MSVRYVEVPRCLRVVENKVFEVTHDVYEVTGDGNGPKVGVGGKFVAAKYEVDRRAFTILPDKTPET